MNRNGYRGQGSKAVFTEAVRDKYCRRFVEARDAFWITSEEFAAAAGLDPKAFRGWLEHRGIDRTRGGYSTLNCGHGKKEGYWRHGGLCTPRADRNGIGVADK